MSTIFYGLYTALHLILIAWGIAIWRQERTLSTAILIGITFGLAYDNAILTLGAWMSSDPTMLALSWPRFILHQLGLPWIILAAFDQIRRTGVPWTTRRWARATAVLLSFLVMIAGILTRLVPLSLTPAVIDGVMRYVANGVSGPPIVSIVGVGLVGVIGISWWRRLRWPWLTLMVIAVFIVEGYPNEAIRRAYGSGLEVALMATLFWTALRLAQGKFDVAETAVSASPLT